MTNPHTFEDLNQDVIAWANKPGIDIIKGSTTHAQFVKLIEEVGELAQGIVKSKQDLIKDSFGDVLVVLIILAAQHDLELADCLQIAYNEIKDRKGRKENGVFVKEEDL